LLSHHNILKRQKCKKIREQGKNIYLTYHPLCETLRCTLLSFAVKKLSCLTAKDNKVFAEFRKEVHKNNTKSSRTSYIC